MKKLTRRQLKDRWRAIRLAQPEPDMVVDKALLIRMTDTFAQATERLRELTIQLKESEFHSRKKALLDAEDVVDNFLMTKTALEVETIVELKILIRALGN